MNRFRDAWQAFLYFIFMVATGMIGHTIYGNGWAAFWSFALAPLAWIKWLICHEVSLSIIRKTFAFFLE